MFDHLRADLKAQLAAAQSVLQQAGSALAGAQADLTTANANLSGAQNALAQAQAAAASATAALNAANALVEERQRERSAALGALNDAKADLADAQEAVRERVMGASAWVARAMATLRQAQTTYDNTAGPLQQAQAAVPPAQAAAASANDQAAAAQQGRDAAATAQAAAQARIGPLTQARDQAQHSIDAINAQLAAIGAREQRITAAPLNRPDLQAAADAELDALAALRRRRHDLYAQRAAAVADGAAALTAQDRTADQLATVVATINAWPDADHFGQVATVRDALNSIVAESLRQRTSPARSRTDDLAQVRSTLAAQVAALNAAIGQAQNEQNDAATKLAAAAAHLAEIQRETP